ncbi:hypothetical protein [Sphingomonas sp. CFBP 13733]|uniref:hypothetical protein n=1 Tax=Sphingomonas sp. CFBP 13733 TaxID=2775291 RepID=UPI001783DEA7|nr:hypothetical protein [Sphingomonas sp. CFBP 13733]MBD8640279.1 hypothetical protein [Sphingomonas sp. CFBP 13733]
MRISRFVAVLMAGTVSGTSGAQTRLDEKSELRLELSPRFGESLLESRGNQPVDESEVRLAVRLVRPVTDTIALEAVPLIAYSPQVYDDRDPSSQVRIGFELRRRLTFGEDGRALRYTSVGKVGVEPFVRYTPSLGFKDAFGSHAFFDNSFGLGARVENAVWFHCRRRWIIAAGLGCNPKRTVGFRVTPQVQYTLSDQEGRRRLTPQVEARVVVPLRDVNIRLVSALEQRRFSDLRTPSDERQRDGRASAGLSVDFAPAIPKLRRLLFGDETGREIVNDFTLEVGASYVRNRSNNPSQNFDRIFFVPAFTYTRQLD